MNAGNDHDPVQSASVALRELVAAADRIRDAASRILRVDRSALAALNHLAGERPIGSVELAGRLNLTASSVTSLVDRLSTAGLAERVAHPSDRRKRVIVLTARGAAAAEWLSELRQAFFTGIRADELETAAASMRSITARINTQVSRLHTGTPPPFA